MFTELIRNYGFAVVAAALYEIQKMYLEHREYTCLAQKFKHLPWCYLLRRGHLSPWWGHIQCPETQSSSLPSDKGKFWQGRGVMSRGWTCWQLPPRTGCYLLPSFSEGEANWPTPFKKQTLHKCHKSLPCLLHSAATALGITRNHPFELYFILQPRVQEIDYFATYLGG